MTEKLIGNVTHYYTDLHVATDEYAREHDIVSIVH